MQGTRVQSLGQEDPLEKEVATPSSILVWEIPQRDEPGGLQSMQGHKESDTLSPHELTYLFFLTCVCWAHHTTLLLQF